MNYYIKHFIKSLYLHTNIGIVKNYIYRVNDHDFKCEAIPIIGQAKIC